MLASNGSQSTDTSKSLRKPSSTFLSKRPSKATLREPEPVQLDSTGDEAIDEEYAEESTRPHTLDRKNRPSLSER
jgi:hypothetical protein